MAEIESTVKEEYGNSQHIDFEETAKVKQEYESAFQNVYRRLQQLEVDLKVEADKRRVAEERLEAQLDMSVIYRKRVTDLEKQISSSSGVTHPIPNPRPGLVKALKEKIEELQQKVRVLEEVKAELELEKEGLAKENATFQRELESLRVTMQEQNGQLVETKDVKQQSIAISDTNRQLREKLNYAMQDHQLGETERIRQKEEIKALKAQIDEMRNQVKRMEAENRMLEERVITIPDLQQLQKDKGDMSKQYQACHQQKEQLAQDCQILQERLDEVTVQYMSLEDVIEEKESLIKMMRAKVKELEERASTISVLQYQSEVWKKDFDTEHEARLQAIEEKEGILHDLDQLRIEAQDAAYLRDENQLLKTEIDTLKREQLQELNPSWAHKDEELKTARLNEVTGTRTSFDGYFAQDPMQTDCTYGSVTCPKCYLQFPDMDAFQIHADDCIE
jgi:chromosome segregation ATPase